MEVKGSADTKGVYNPMNEIRSESNLRREECGHSAGSDAPAFWALNLGEFMYITDVKLYGRSGCSTCLVWQQGIVLKNLFVYSYRTFEMDAKIK